LVLDFTSISISPIAKNINKKLRKQSGYAAAEAEENNRHSYVNAFGTETYEIAVLTLGDCSRKRTCKTYQRSNEGWKPL